MPIVFIRHPKECYELAKQTNVGGMMATLKKSDMVDNFILKYGEIPSVILQGSKGQALWERMEAIKASDPAGGYRASFFLRGYLDCLWENVHKEGQDEV